MAATIIARIDEEVNKHLLSVSDLRVQRNSYLPIFRLPPETLENIFIHVARDGYETGRRSGRCRVPCWVHVSYVCRYWRTVALNCPSLWSYHFAVSLAWTEELLIRSKKALLKINIPEVTLEAEKRVSNLVEKLLRHMERIQELRLDVSDVVLPSTVSFYAPHLEILDIVGPGRGTFSWASTISDEGIPPLRVLKLDSIPVPWNALNLSGLTTLLLRRVPFPSQQNIPECLAMLSHAHALTILYLQHALPSARSFLSNGDLDHSPRVSLPHLTRLSFVAPLSTVIALLSCVDIPLQTEVRLDFRYEDDSSIDDYAPIPSILGQRFRQFNALSSFGPTIRSVTIDSPLSSTFALCVSGESFWFHSNPLMEFATWDCNMPLVVLVRMGDPIRADMYPIIHDICDSIPMVDVETLQVVDPPLLHNFWRDTLVRLPRLRRLKLSEGSMPNLAPLLTIAPDEQMETEGGNGTGDPDQNLGPTLVPRLEDLILERISFETEADDGVSQQSLRDVLSTRSTPHPRLVVIGRTEAEEEPDFSGLRSNFDPILEGFQE